MKSIILSLLLLATSIISVAQKAGWKKACDNPEFLHRSIKEVTDVIVHDIYSPPVASRIYAYTTVAAYEAAHFSDIKYISLAGQLHGLSALPVPTAGKQYCYPLAAINAVLLVAKSMIISEDKIAAFQAGILLEFKAAGMPDEVYDSSLAYGKLVAGSIIAWAAKDHYKETRSLSKYPVGNDTTSWKPTPPAYIKAIEPHWDKLRPFLIDSAQQFKPLPPTTFSADKGSQFYKEAKAVMDAGLSLTPE